MWRVQNGLHPSITYSFLPVGHTKFALDWCFGLLKQKLRRTKVDCLKDIVDTVNNSANVNFAQEVGSQMGKLLFLLTIGRVCSPAILNKSPQSKSGINSKLKKTSKEILF